MAPPVRKRENRENRENQFYDVGVQGRYAKHGDNTRPKLTGALERRASQSLIKAYTTSMAWSPFRAFSRRQRSPLLSAAGPQPRQSQWIYKRVRELRRAYCSVRSGFVKDALTRDQSQALFQILRHPTKSSATPGRIFLPHDHSRLRRQLSDPGRVGNRPWPRDIALSLPPAPHLLPGV